MDGKADIERELEAMGFQIYRRYDDGVPTGAWAIRGSYRSAEGRSWQQLRAIVQADGQWYAPTFKAGDRVTVRIVLTRYEGCAGTVKWAISDDEVLVAIDGTYAEEVYTAGELELEA